MTACSNTGLSVVNVSKRLGRDLILDGISLEVSRGEVLALVGPSGAGKSTLLRCINHLEIPDGGVICLDGEVIGYVERHGRLHERSPPDLARQRSDIGMVFQRFHLFPHLNAEQNVALALRSTRHMEATVAAEAARERLATVGLAHKLLAYPNELSGGQQQRVAIARALALEPKLMLFDEPTSALDPEFAGEVREVMLKVAATGMTMVVVSHDIGFARHVASQAAFMDHGRLIEAGRATEVLGSPQSPRARAFLASVK
jgi:polar amino acid transport system ATP-binding protein